MGRPRDLRELLERRWEGRSDEEFDAEVSLVGWLDALDSGDGMELRIAGGTSGPAALQAFLTRVRSETPDERFWTGVRTIRTDGADVVLEFMERRTPLLRQLDDVEVACHRHDPEALARATELAGQSSLASAGASRN